VRFGIIRDSGSKCFGSSCFWRLGLLDQSYISLPYIALFSRGWRWARVAQVLRMLSDPQHGRAPGLVFGTWDTGTIAVPFVRRASAHVETNTRFQWPRSTGKERDTESGNDYFGARYYSSSMGRFMSPDWSAQVEPVPYAKLGDPQTLNLYGGWPRFPTTMRVPPVPREGDRGHPSLVQQQAVRDPGTCRIPLSSCAWRFRSRASSIPHECAARLRRGSAFTLKMGAIG
jgi:RHS repeat-associated protein